MILIIQFLLATMPLNISTNIAQSNYFALESTLLIPHSVVIMSNFPLDTMFQYFRFILN